MRKVSVKFEWDIPDGCTYERLREEIVNQLEYSGVFINDAGQTECTGKISFVEFNDIDTLTHGERQDHAN